MEQWPLKPSQESGSKEPFISEVEARAFLESNGTKPLDVDSWKPGVPVLYLLQDYLKTHSGHFQNLPLTERPTLARLDAPTSITYDYGAEGGRTFAVENAAGGQIDYYRIDPVTKEITFVLSSNRVRGRDNAYQAYERCLYGANDSLFPKAETQAP